MSEGPRDRWLILFLAGWALLAVASIWLRPLWPVDETRYASVAWEMWLRGDFLVPYINGEPYSHKPPLLFWLIHLGWAVFGVNEWWPRLVAPLCAFAALPLSAMLARLLWPDSREHGTYAAWTLFGTILFAAFVTLVMFDLLLMLSTMIAMIGVLRSARGEMRAGILWLGVGIGLGVLAKGPVILLHVLPVAVVAPWWAPATRAALGKWYLGLLAGVLLGAAIALAWALPAGYFGGEAYRRAIFWGQTAGRVSESFAHRAPWWYYAPLLPAILFPWFVWPAFWRGLRASGEAKQMPVRFLAAWLLLTVIGFSFVSGKQAKYLVPMLPGFALLVAHALTRIDQPPRRWDMILPAAGFFALPALLFYARSRPAALELPEWAATLPLWPVVASLLLGPLVLAVSGARTIVGVRVLAFAVLGTLAVVSAGLMPAMAPFGDPGPAAAHLAELQARRIPLAHLGKYHATYNFAGRLTKPIEILDPGELAPWAARHPGGQVIVVERKRHSGEGARPEYQAPFRGAWIQVWRCEELLRQKY